jgi:uncharacterized protein YjbI with pentapeptide repeats
MSQFTIRGTSADLPVLDEEAELERVSSLGTDGGLVSDFEFSEATVSALTAENVTLLDGKVRSLMAERASMSGMRARSVEFTGCQLASLRWAAGKISRTRFDGCKLLGARFDGVTMEHVVFTGCKLDYAVFDQVRVAGPVIFAGCSLRETEFTGCDLAGALFDDCDLRLTAFGRGHYRGCDLRGNDLSAVNGAHHLKHVVIDRSQLPQLAEALAAELEVTFGDPDRGRRDSGHFLSS